MKSRLPFYQQDANGSSDTGDGDINFGAVFQGTLANHSGGTPSGLFGPPTSTPISPVLPDESVEALAAVTGSGTGGPNSVVAETSSSGFTINLIFDAAAMAAPASFRTGIEQAASILSATITNKITVNVDIDYSGTGGGAAAGPDNGQYVNYSTVRADLIANATPGDTSFNALPTGSTIQGQSQVAVWNAQLKLFGLISPNDTTTDDGSATFATDINSSLLVGVALHELTHAIGRVPYGSQPDIFDFYRFTSAGTRLFTDNIPASSAYFSLDGGTTKIADFGVSSDPSDFLNSGVQGGNDPFNEFYSGSTLQTLTPIDKEMLDALGFNTMPPGLAFVSNATDALQGGAALTLLSGAPNINDPGSTTLASATIKIANAGGNAVSGDKLFVNGIENGSLGNGVTASWNATTNTLALTGAASVSVYDTLLSEITFQDTGTDTSSGSHPVRTVTWTINDGTNSYTATSQATVNRAPVAANDTAADAVGATLTKTSAGGVLSNDTDLDADGLTVTGVSDTAHGAGTVGSSLAGVYGHLTLNSDGSYSYVADITTAINAAPTGSHLQDVFSYTMSDGSGGTATASLTVTLDRPVVVTASNVTLGASQTSVAAASLFSATDPDGDAITTYAFKDTGPGHFVLNGVVEPNNQEVDVSAAQLSQLTYQASAGTIDTLQLRVAEGTSWSSWQSFTVMPVAIIQVDGATTLVQAGSNYFLNPTSGGTGPELKFGGNAIVAGQFGSSLSPIGAVQVTNGYDVAWHDTGSGLFSIWSVDSNGNYVSNLTPLVTGNSSTLESFETVFNQDFNGDGHIGLPPPPPPTVIQVDGATTLVQAGSNYFLNPTSGGTGPELKFGGNAIVAGQFGSSLSPIGAVQVTNGYDVAWHDTSSGLFSIWSADSNGNYLSNLTPLVTGNSSTLESFETVFNQDFNGDGHIGLPPPPPPTVIQVDGATTLVQAGSNYFLNPTSGGTGPELKFGGNAIVAGQFGSSLSPIGAVQVTNGYDVAWHDTSSGLFSIWSADSNGNYLSNLTPLVTGNSSTLESFETVFNQDFNGDGHIGLPPPPPPTVIQVDGATTLVQAGSNYFLNPTSGGTGPELKFGGNAIVAGQFGSSLSPIGAVQVTNGYDVAWHDTSSGLFSIWSADSNGNYLSNLTPLVTGNSSTLESFETVFNQDFNGDGHIGLSATAPMATAGPNANFTPDNFHFAGGAPATGGHDGFAFAFESGAASGSNAAPAADLMASSATFTSNHTDLAGAHQDAFSTPATPDAAAHGPLWLMHHGDFHLI